MSGQLPPPLRRSGVWIVEVYGEPPESVRDWLPDELEELAEKHGEGSDEYFEALGPTAYIAPVLPPYGPYTERQAKAVAEHLNRPDVMKRERLSSAHAMPLLRYVPKAGS